MEITKLRIDSWLNQIEKKVFIFLIAAFASQVTWLGSHLVFLLPLVSLAFVAGKGEMLSCLLGALLGCLLFSWSWELALLIGGYALLLYGLSFMYVLKTRMIPFLAATFIGLLQLAAWFWQASGSISAIVMNTAVCGVLSYAYLQCAPLLVHQQEKYTPLQMLAVGLMMVSALFSLQLFSTPFMLVFIRWLLLVLCFVVDVKTGFELVMAVGFLLLLAQPGLKDEVLALIIPMSVFQLTAPKSKLGFGLVYLFSHWLLAFFIQEHLYIFAGEVIFSSLLFMLVPGKFYRQLHLACHQEPLLVSQIGGMLSYQRRMSRQLENFSDLFFRIAGSFDDAAMKANVLTYVGSVYENVCARCMNSDQCFNRHQGDHRLVKLMRKGIMDGLSKEELHYIERYCLNMAEYKKAVKEQHQLFKHQKEMNEEYHTLKHHLYSQLFLVGDLLKQYAQHVDCADLYGEENIKDLLEGYHYQVPYIHKDFFSKDEYCLDIGMTEITRDEVYDVVIPVLEKFLDTRLNLLVIEDSARQLGYMHLVLSNHQNYQLVYGIQQISKDAASCGDSYLCFRHHQYTMIALSDGMGYGPKAHEESELTLDVFSRLLKSGIELDECIQTINSLLKIKNRMEMFTTLDLLMFDTNDAQATFLKNGATPSFVYHYNQLDKVQTRALPIGIVSKVDTHSEKYQCADQDLIIMYSDGFDHGIEDVIEHCLKQCGQCHPQKLADAMMQELLQTNQVDDDATIIVARVEDVTQIHMN